jgi:hypothetical protein
METARINTFYLPSDFLKNSIKETLAAARLCIEYQKSQHEGWGHSCGTEETSLGALGIPACILLSCFIDAVGSAIRRMNGVTHKKNFDVLKSLPFDIHLKDDECGAVYDDFRSLLVHNGLIQSNMEIKLADGLPFEFRKGVKPRVRIVRLVGLLNACERAYSNLVGGINLIEEDSFPLLKDNRNVVQSLSSDPSTTGFWNSVTSKS